MFYGEYGLELTVDEYSRFLVKSGAALDHLSRETGKDRKELKRILSRIRIRFYFCPYQYAEKTGVHTGS
jgi:hypothetical protein